MTDLAALGLSIRSDGVVVASDRLDDFKSASDRAADGADHVERRSGALGVALRRLAGIAGIVTGVIATVFSGRAIISGISTFETSMSRVAAITRATDGDLQLLRQTAQDLGRTTEFSAAQAADGLTFLGMAGFTASESIAAIPAVLDLATASGMGLAEAADTASNIMSGFGIAAGNAASVADVLAAAASKANTNVAQLGQAMSTVAPISAALGIGLEDTAAAIGVLADAGIQGERAGTALRSVMAALAGPTTQAQEALAAYGLTAADVDPATRSLADVMATLAGAGISTADAMTIFGREAASGALVLTGASGRLRDFGNELHNVDGAASDMATTMRDNLGGDIQGLQSALAGLILALGEAGLTGILRSSVQGLTDLVRVIADSVEPAFQALASVIVGLAVTQIPALLSIMARLPALFISSGGAVGVFNGALAVTSGIVAALGGPVSVLLGVIAGVATAVYLFRDSIANLVAPIDEVKVAQEALNQAMGVFHSSVAPESAAAAIRAANAYREQAAAARDAAAGELALAEAELARFQSAPVEERGLFTGGAMEQSFAGDVFAAQSRLDRANAALVAANIAANRTAREITGSTSESLVAVADASRTVTVEVTGLGAALDGVATGGAAAAIDDLTEAQRRALAILGQMTTDSVTLTDVTSALEEMYRSGAISADEFAEATRRARDEMQAAGDAGVDVRSSLAGVFADALTGTKSLSDGLRGLLQQLAQMMANRAFMTLLGGGGGGGGVFNGLFDRLFSGFLDAGGTIGAGQFAVVGERRPEIVTGPARVIGGAQTARVMHGGGGNDIIPVQVNVINEGGGEVRQSRRRGPNGQEIIDIAISDSFASGRQDRALGRFGAQPQTVRR